MECLKVRFLPKGKKPKLLPLTSSKEEFTPPHVTLSIYVHLSLLSIIPECVSFRPSCGKLKNQQTRFESREDR